jgi:hypothetical protein
MSDLAQGLYPEADTTGGVGPYDHIHSIYGAGFFDDLITHPEVEKAYERYLDGAFLRQGQAPFARWVMLHVQSNPLPICTRPRVLIKGKRT